MATLPPLGNSGSTPNPGSTSGGYVPAGATTGNPNPSGVVVSPGITGGGFNPAENEKANELDPSIANQILPGETNVGAQPATTPEPYDEKQIVSELADRFGIKAQKGKSLEALVADHLAEKYDIKLKSAGRTTTGTGTGQGTVGQLRHNIASWFVDSMGRNVENLHNQGQTNTDYFKIDQNKINEIKNPQLRQQAQDRLDREENNPNFRQPANEGGSPGTPEPKDTVNSKALQQILDDVGSKLGIQGSGQTSITQIASAEGLPTQSSGAATPGVSRTAGEDYQNLVKLLNDPKADQKDLNTLVANLQDAGLLDRSGSGPKQKNGSVYTNAQIQNAYQQVLTQQVKNKQTQSQALGALAEKGTAPNGPTSEIESYVQGIASGFGVGLTQQQITKIANDYGTNATTQGDPSSVADEIKNAVVDLYDPNNPDNPSGIASTMFTNIQQAALQYQIPISDAQIGQMVKTDLQAASVESIYAAADSATNDAIKHFQTQAEGLYPALAGQISKGQTVQNLVAPYFNVAESITGVPASTMMTEQKGGGVSKWSGFLQGGQNPAAATKAGGPADTGPQMMTLDEWKHTLMTDPQYGFQNTTAGRQMGEQMAAAIANEFGKVSTMGGTSQPFNAYQGASDLSANTA